jgi:hypothetical protein
MTDSEKLEVNREFRCSSSRLGVMRAHRRNENTPLRLTAPSRIPKRKRKRRKRKGKRNQ